MFMKRSISVVLLIAFCLIMFTATMTVNASAETDTEEMADVLNKLSILQGSNGNYLLDDNLQRAHAIALIIRILGKEDYVKQHADELKYITKYSDVPSTAWYAPYVEYSTLESIVGGNPDGTFGPIDNVTEKAFLKMTLCALGYEYGVDFDWSNIYQKAYNIGIVTDLSYFERTQDDTDYLRAEAIEVIYNALNTYIKGTSTKMVYTMVNEGMVTNDEVRESGLFTDEIQTEIESVVSLTPNSIEIKLNENIQNVDLHSINICEATLNDRELEVKTAGFRGNSIQVVTSGQMPGIKYDVSIVNVTDSEGNISGELSGEFTGFTPQKVESDFFRIEKVEQLTSNVLNVYFTHPVNINSETPAFYELFEDAAPMVTGAVHNMTVKRLQAYDNAVSIYLKDEVLELGKVYTLRISGRLTSNYGVKLGEGFGETRDFVAIAEHTNQLDVSSVEAWTNKSVRLLFNREIDPAWAGKRLNYTVYDKNNNAIDVINAIVTESGEYSGREVLLSLSYSLEKTKHYKLRIDYIPDVYKQSVIEEKECSFSGSYPDNKDLAVTSAFSEQNNSVVMTFNKALDPEAAMKLNNYSIRSVSGTSFYSAPEKIYYFEEGGEYKVKIFTSAGRTFDNKYTYAVNVNNMRDSLGNIQTGLIHVEFKGGGSTNTKPQMVEAVTISKDAVKVTFSIEIAFDPNNISTTNYTLEYAENSQIIKMIPTGVTYVDAKTIVLRFDELDPSVFYQIRFRSITDYSELYTRTADDGGDAITVRWGT